ncbi:Hpt domain-containing protein [Methylopila sp. 73B]|uniref:Hpt domain-containing protein n=1 Tax=Methylopila sp. 73B TaxID=1120792 RepID=UPI00037C9341|nr:Hpt domain-containing protein [Methylopila sp. 73B]
MPEASHLDGLRLSPEVAAESFKDHMVLRPPNKLKERATRQAPIRDNSEAQAVMRAELALERLSPEFDGWMRAEIETLEACRAAIALGRDEPTIAALFRSAHDLRGQSATFGYPLAGEIADGLCDLIEYATPDTLPRQALIDRHVEAIRAMVRENVRERSHPVGKELANRLAELRSEAAKKG